MQSRYQANYIINNKNYLFGSSDLTELLTSIKLVIDKCQHIEVNDTQDGKVYNKDKLKELTLTLLVE